MVELSEYTLGELTESHNAARRPIKSSERVPGAVPYYGASGVVDWVDGFTHEGEFLLVSEDGENLRSRSTAIAFCASGKLWVNNHAHILRGREPSDTRFLEYALAATDITGYLTGSAQPKLTKSALESIRLLLPSASNRAAIAEVLSALDDKIAANDRTVQHGEELADALFTEALTHGSRTVELGAVAEFHNRRRVPLSSRDRDARRGDVPYYGAAGRLDFVDEALFDEPLVLVGEDGSVVTDDDGPVVQYVWGPAWVNNHAHVLTGRVISTELLRVAIRRAKVAHLVTGAVQPKLSMRNLKTLELSLPLHVEAVDEDVRVLADSERTLVDESSRLAATRDELLPLLMSGKVCVRDAETAVGEVL